MRYYKIPTATGIDFSRHIPMEQYITEDYIYAGFSQCSPPENWEELTEEAFRAAVEEAFPHEPQPEPAPEPLSDQEQLLLDTAINTEYLVTLADLGL